MRVWDPGRITRLSKLSVYARLVRVEHTLFSLPFATIGLLVARATNPVIYALSYLALFGLRAAAMSFNNVADADIDALNPRTSKRPVVTGIVSTREALAITLLAIMLYFAAAYSICIPALLYATPLLLLALSYPYAKRVHPLPHLHLGLVLGMSVFGGWVAGMCSTSCTGANLSLSNAPWLIVFGVALWVAGFDVIYSTMDYEFDKRIGLGSIPALLGPERALKIAVMLECLAASLWTLGALLYSGIFAAITSLAAGTVAVGASLLALKSTDNIPKAFNMNLAVGFIALPGFVLDMVA
ncbi:4-hydroxybenzoate polyprenyltransferase [Pyrolobus fumarii 1A]|uniref:4-hydroxybenzoate polyprenyltransferase n=1 Tax=Pyrolobus fumarii (strain DSM 11204 / 1A) TaxID=694429 RepID=G0EHP7_PYRF1|nr:UbiA-like polyprenyltransferase [Pyrolobus fumarii]AEM39400.1 4-hydroxybenzoate polyprenyltransferase [Pyrolobus fumarii 1A]